VFTLTKLEYIDDDRNTFNSTENVFDIENKPVLDYLYSDYKIREHKKSDDELKQLIIGNG
jgi:hypothetical protein